MALNEYQTEISEVAYKDEAIQLVSFNEGSKQISLNPNALEFLKTVKGPIAVIAVAGLYRTGKSYLLNRILLDRSNGFGVGSTVNACTKGLWIWGRPIPGRTRDGRECNILVVDSEGIGAVDEDNDHDTRVFVLALLIASHFLYNSQGAIDEEAISNLSLVINLTKHIQICSNSQESGYEDFAEYLPGFTWILRDFSLQLVDSNGDTISQKEYLERVLEPQKGFSDAVEEKNRIRRLIKNFFPERDCHCLVRPIGDEESLQNLAERDPRSLRPEFFEQMESLREATLSHARPKALNGKELSGEMLSNLIESYITSINNGAVPTIESAWTYLCRNQTAQALKEAQELYENELLDGIGEDYPVNEELLKDVHREAKDKALRLFGKKALGGEKEDYQEELIEGIRGRYRQVKEENDEASQQACMYFLEQNYKVIQNRIQKGEFAGYLEFEKDFRTFQEYFLKHGPDGPGRNLFRLKFSLDKLLVAADFFTRSLESKVEGLQEVAEQRLQQVQKNLGQANADLKEQLDAANNNIAQLDSEKTEISIREAAARQQIDLLKKEHETTQDSLRAELKAARAQQVAAQDEANAKVWEFEDKMKEMQRKQYQEISENEEKVLLLEQKVAFLDTSLAEAKKREKELLEEVKKEKSSHSVLVREANSRNEAQIKHLQSQLEEAFDKMQDLERIIEEKKEQNQIEEVKSQDLLAQLQEATDKSKALAQSYMNQIAQIQSEFEEKLSETTQEDKLTISKLRARLDETEKKLKHSEEVQILDSSTYESDKVIMIQKMDFLEMQIKEYKEQIEEERSNHLNMLNVLQNVTSPQAEDFEAEIARMREQYQIDLQDIEREHLIMRKKLKGEVEILQRDNEEYKVQVEELQKEAEKMRKALEGAVQIGVRKNKDYYENIIQDLQSQVSSLQSQPQTPTNPFTPAPDAKLLQQIEEQRLLIEKLQDAASNQQANLKSQYSQNAQETEFLQERIQQLEADLENRKQMYEDLTRALSSNGQDEIGILIQKLTEENSKLQNRLQQNFHDVQQAQISKQKSMTQYQDQLRDLSQKLEFSPAEPPNFKYQIENEALRQKLDEIQRDHEQRFAKYERERNLWENKFEFLLKQRDTAREDLLDAQHKFDQTLLYMQLRENSDKGKWESTINVNVQSIKQRYDMQLGQIQEAHQSTLTELTEKLRSLERENRTLRSQNAQEQRERNSISETWEFKMREALQQEEGSRSELQIVKRELSGIIEENMSRYHQEKEHLSIQIGEMERKLGEMEQERAELLMQHEKEKAKWSLERQQLVRKTEGIAQMLSNAEKKKDSLLRENEHLKSTSRRESPTPSLLPSRGPSISQYLSPSAGISYEDFARNSPVQDNGRIRRGEQIHFLIIC